MSTLNYQINGQQVRIDELIEAERLTSNELSFPESENMMEFLKADRDQILEKEVLLEKVGKQLKMEFVGIDSVIDRIIDAASSWFLFPGMQERPVIVNLWGLTGTGKTSLVNRFSELIGLPGHRFDLGREGEQYEMRHNMQEIFGSRNNEPFIIILDEFQHARTIDERGRELNKYSRVIWDIMDYGKLYISSFSQRNYMKKLIKKLEYLLRQGVKVENGLVIEGHSIYRNCFNSPNQADSCVLHFVPNKSAPNSLKFSQFHDFSDIQDELFDLYANENDCLSSGEIQNDLMGFDGFQTIEYLRKLYDKLGKKKELDGSKTLIFVLGNLDEVYTMSEEFNPDICADEFHRQSLEITVTQVKEKLKKRFRNEQIARLGNIHIIYPAFNRESYLSIIRLELNKISNRVWKQYRIKLSFDESMVELIYDEGVYPTQGTRPVFTTIHQMINCRLGKIIRELYISDIVVNEIRWYCKPQDDETANICIEMVLNEETVHIMHDEQKLTLGKLRREKQDDTQAIVAVHESGHAILSSLLLKTVPHSIISVTADSKTAGFVISGEDCEFIAKNQIINRLSVWLGGFVAEQLVFGHEYVTAGAESDIKRATEFVARMLHNAGMSELPIRLSNRHDPLMPKIIYDGTEAPSNTEIRRLIAEATRLAQDTLNRQKRLLAAMANYLSDHRIMNRNMILDYLKKYAVDFDPDKSLGKGQYYRQRLKFIAEN